MTERLKHTLTTALTILFLTPAIVQLFDASFHHHDHFSCTEKQGHHLHVYHKKCIISTFELSHFSVQKTVSVPKIEFSNGDPVFNIQSNNFTNQPDYSFLLRAPPKLT
jgi:hypothetical protein